jgi:ATP-dependent DNA helicase RecG
VKNKARAPAVSLLARLGLAREADLLFHLPLRYEDRTRLTPIGALAPGEQALVEGRIQLADVVYTRRRSLLCRIGDGSGSFIMRLFYFNAAQQQGLARGWHIRCFGTVRRGPALFEMIHPEYRVSEHPLPAPVAECTPVYPAAEGVRQPALRRAIGGALDRHLEAVTEHLPEELRKPLRLPTLANSLSRIHRPTPALLVNDGLALYRQRLALEELLAHHLALKRLRTRRERIAAPVLTGPGELLRQLRAALGFEPTEAQKQAVRAVRADLARPVPMLRLLQGDVGSGKTVVAAAAAACAVEAGWQAAVLAPTELLAEQHHRTFTRWLEPLGIRVARLSARGGARERREARERIAAHQAEIAVGTHALFQEGVAFARLGLAVVDEQHRFGVDQRMALRDKGAADARVPHQLIMTATPIPRTLAMSYYADLDVTTLDEMPPGRIPVQTAVLPAERRDEVVARIAQACARGGQVYWVCPLVDESENLEAEAATETARVLAAALPALRVGLVHGRIKAEAREEVMRRFRDGEVDLLVATTVIEVGVDVPNANLMIVENAERLGLAQLHQLRGRVGRGGERSYCVLLYRGPLSEAARARLHAMRETTDGFEIARRDLELRGPGEVLGTRQSGMLALRIADLARDQALLPIAERLGRALSENHPEAAEAIIHRWLGEDVEYGHVG